MLKTFFCGRAQHGDQFFDSSLAIRISDFIVILDYNTTPGNEWKSNVGKIGRESERAFKNRLVKWDKNGIL